MSENDGNDRSQPNPRVIVEDKPTMRSVSMMSAPPSIPLRSAMPPSVKFSTPPAKTWHVPDTKPAPVVSGPRWRVTTPLTKPSYHEFERTHVTVSGVSCIEISKRIDECLSKASIAATFDNEEAVARANSCECLKFAVRLWKATDGITVEVQRTKGCSFLYNQTVKKIFHAATTGSELPPARSLPPFRPVRPIPPMEWESHASDGLGLVSDSIRQQSKTDAHVLAIQSLVDLSKSENCKAYCAKLVFSEDSMVLDALVSLIVTGRIGRETHGSEFLKDDSTAMRRNAVSTLANCLEESQSSDCLASVLAKFPKLTSPQLLNALLSEVVQDARPHCAAAACRCLHALCRNDEARSTVMEVRSSISSVAAQGHHQALQEESNKLLRVL